MVTLQASYETTVKELVVGLAQLNDWDYHEFMETEKAIEWIEGIKARLFGCQDTTANTMNLVKGLIDHVSR